MEHEGSRCLQGRTNTYQLILILYVIPLNVVGYLIVGVIVIIIITISGLPSFLC